jgi:flavin reductase (DIM6/NTAB) family NADH-FMN oxidoreductase RutF
MKYVNPKNIHRLFYPSVPLLMCASYGNLKSAMPVVSYAALSEIPPLVGVSCLLASNTLKLARKSGCFGLCILDKRYYRSVEFLGTHSSREIKDKISASGLTPVKAKSINCYVISESSAVVECINSRRIATGDHVLLIGKVVESYASEDFREYWSFRNYKPILYTGIKDGFTMYGEG